MSAPDLTALAAEIHANACAKGWWPDAPGPEDYERAALMIGCEVAELVEEYRRAPDDGELSLIRMPDLCPDQLHDVRDHEVRESAASGIKPDGFAIELADIVIRTLDLCAAMGRRLGVNICVVHPADVEGFSAVELFLMLQWSATQAHYPSPAPIMRIVRTSLLLAQRYNIDLWAMVRLKHAYNLTRSYRHGGMRL